MTYSATSPVFAKSRVTPPAFRAALWRWKSPAIIEASGIHDVLTSAGIDPAVFLGQFAAESSYGTEGFAKTTHSPGNIIISRPAIPHWTRAFGGRPWKAANGRTYAAFLTWRDGTRAYAALMGTYKLRGWSKTIATMASHWLGMADATRSGYVRNIVANANLVLLTGVTVVAPPVLTPAQLLDAIEAYVGQLTGAELVKSALARNIALLRARLG